MPHPRQTVARLPQIAEECCEWSPFLPQQHAKDVVAEFCIAVLKLYYERGC